MNKGDQLKIRILELLDSADEAHSYYELARKLGSSFRSLKSASEFLERIRLIHIERKMSPSRSYNFITITRQGRAALQFLKK